MNKYLEPYVPMMDFLAAFLGKSTEIVLHDLTDWHCSVVAIRNGHISGREVGSPVTDLALQVLNEAKYKDVPYISGYQSRARNGHVPKSATYFIHDNHRNIVGMMCLNTDCQNMVRARDLMTEMIAAEYAADSVVADDKRDAHRADKYEGPRISGGFHRCLHQ